MRETKHFEKEKPISKKKTVEKIDTLLEKIFPILPKGTQGIISEEAQKLRQQKRSYLRSRVREDYDSAKWVEKREELLQTQPVEYFEEQLETSKEDLEALLSSSGSTFKYTEEEKKKHIETTKEKIANLQITLNELEKALEIKTGKSPTLDTAQPISITEIENKTREQEKVRILASLKETIETATRELEAINTELAAIRARREARKQTAAQEALDREKTETYTPQLVATLLQDTSNYDSIDFVIGDLWKKSKSKRGGNFFVTPDNYVIPTPSNVTNSEELETLEGSVFFEVTPGTTLGNLIILKPAKVERCDDDLFKIIQKGLITTSNNKN